MKNFIIAQVFTIISLGLNVISTQQESKKGILLFNGLSNIFLGIQYLLLGAWTGSISYVIAAGRNAVFGSFKKDIPLYILIIYFIIAIGLNIPAINGWISLIPIFNILLYGYGIYQKDIKVIKIIVIIVSITGIIYDSYNLAIITCITEIVSGTGAIIGYINTLKLEKNIVKKA